MWGLVISPKTERIVSGLISDSGPKDDQSKATKLCLTGALEKTLLGKTLSELAYFRSVTW